MKITKFYFVTLTVIFLIFTNITFSQGWSNLYNVKSGAFWEINYGNSVSNSIKDLKSEFNNIGSIELRLGYIKNFEEDNFYVAYKVPYFFTYNNNTLSASKNDVGKVNSTLISFGQHSIQTGLGFGGRKFRIIFYSPILASSLSWAKLTIDSFPSQIDSSEKIIYKDFGEQIRYGAIREGGISIDFGKLRSTRFGINLGYESQIIYPRHLFWKDLLSQAIEGCGSVGILGLAGLIAESSPEASVIFNFVLQNALSFGFQYLRKEKMNWPFDTTKPLSIDRFKIGFYVAF